MDALINVGTVCVRDVVVTHPDAPLKDAANLMRTRHVGCLVVARPTPAGNVVAGMLTDRDIAIVAVARDFNPHTIRVADVMSTGALTITENASLYSALQLMRRGGVRRLPVVTRAEILVGVIALDDVLRMLVEELAMFVDAMRTEAVYEQEMRV